MNNTNEQIIKSIKADSDALKSEIIFLNKEFEKLEKKKKNFEELGKTTSKAFLNVSSSIRIAKASLEESEKQLDANTKALKINNGSLQQNKAFLESLTAQYEKISKAKGNDSDEAKKLNSYIGDLNSTIESQGEKVEESSEKFDFHKKSIEAINGSIEDITDKAKEFDAQSGKMGPNLASSLESAKTGFKAMKEGLSVVKTGFQSVGGAIKATGFGLLLLVLQSLTEWLTKNATGQKVLSGILTGVAKVVEIVKKAFENLGGSIVKALLNPVDNIKSVWNNVVTTLSNQFKPFSTMLEGLFSGNFSKVKEGYAQLKNNVSAIAKGVVTTFKNAKEGLINTWGEVKKAYKQGFDKKYGESKGSKKVLKEVVDLTKQAEEERLASIARMAKSLLEGYAKEVDDANTHFNEMKSKYSKFLDDYSKMSAKQKAAHLKEYKAVNAAVEQFEVEHQATLNSITKKFQDEDFKKLDEYYQEFNKIGKNARQQAFDQLQKDYMQKQADVNKILESNTKIEHDLQNQIFEIAGQDPRQLTQAQIAANQQKIEELEKLRAKAESAVARAKSVSEQLRANNIKDTGKMSKAFAREDEKEDLQDSITQDQKSSNWQKEFTDKKHLLDLEFQQAIEAEGLQAREKLRIQKKYKEDTAELNKAKQDAEVANQKKYLDSLKSVATAVTSIFGKNTVAAKLAFRAQQAAAAAAVVIETKRSIMNIWSANSPLPFVGVPKAIAETAMVAAIGATNLAAIIKQKPGFAGGGHYTSDGRGAVLPGYSLTDNTNAYLRSGEAVVVSEAMRNPWARNLVSAINVAHGGRDFSVPNSGRGYAIGGIFTDGGNANRYYSQPVNDQKDLANTLAYQMINNFPPIYVDVKDVNNQQNILAQTVDRVNL